MPVIVMVQEIQGEGQLSMILFHGYTTVQLTKKKQCNNCCFNRSLTILGHCEKNNFLKTNWMAFPNYSCFAKS